MPFSTPVLWVAVDALAHALAALLIVAPAIAPAPTSLHALALIALVTAAATLIDLDHFLAARALRLHSARHLQLRPATHSLTFALAAGAVGYLVSRRPPIVWPLTAALASHVLRDASSGTAPLLWPLPSTSVPR